MQIQAILYKWIHAVAWCVYMQIQAILYKWIRAVAWCVYMQVQAILYKWIHAEAWCVYMQIQAILYKWIHAVAWCVYMQIQAYYLQVDSCSCLVCIQLPGVYKCRFRLICTIGLMHAVAWLQRSYKNSIFHNIYVYSSSPM
jgi:hypothetical protein